VLVGWGLPGIVVLLLASEALALSVQYRLCTRVFPQVRKFPRFALGELRTLLGFGGWVTVSSAVSPILVYLDRFAIGMFLTMTAVAYYTAPYEMVTRLLLVPASLAATLFPAFSTLSGQGRLGRLETFVTRSVKYLLLILGPTIIMIVSYSREILHLWLGPVFATEGALALQVLAVGVLINSLAHIPYAVVQAVGRPDLTAKFHLVELPVHALLVWLLLGLWGIPGAALAWSIRVAIDALLLFIASCHLSSLSPRIFLRERMLQGALLLAFLGLMAVGIQTFSASAWLRVMGPAVVSTVAGLSLWHYLLSATDRMHVVQLLRIRSVK